MAKPMPWAWAPLSGLAAASVGMPITCPEALTSAPPLLPGLMGALVWIALGKVAAAEPGAAGSVTARPVAEMMPSVKPRGGPVLSFSSAELLSSAQMPDALRRSLVAGLS